MHPRNKRPSLTGNPAVACEGRLVRAPARIVGSLAAHVLAGDLHFEEGAVGAHAELVTHPVVAAQLVCAGRTRQAGCADRHCPIEDDAVFLLGEM